jgi:hypothetical protein
MIEAMIPNMDATEPAAVIPLKARAGIGALTFVYFGARRNAGALF